MVYTGELIGTTALALSATLSLQNAFALNRATNPDPGGGLAPRELAVSLENAPTLDAIIIGANQIDATAIEVYHPTAAAAANDQNIETALPDTAITVCTANASTTAKTMTDNIATTNPTNGSGADGTADFRANPTPATGFLAFDGNATGLQAHDLS